MLLNRGLILFQGPDAAELVELQAASTDTELAFARSIEAFEHASLQNQATS